MIIDPATVTPGDRFITNQHLESSIESGYTFTVIGYYGESITCVFEEYIDGHDCNGKAKDYHGWFLSKHYWSSGKLDPIPVEAAIIEKVKPVKKSKPIKRMSKSRFTEALDNL